MTKISFSAVKGIIEITITYVTHQKMFHFASILNSDALYNKSAEKN